MGAEKFVVVLPVSGRRRVVVDQLHPQRKVRGLPNGLFQPFHANQPRLVVVQAQADLGDVGMIAEELNHGAGRGSAEGEVMAVPPIAPGQLHPRGQGQGVNRTFRHGQPWADWVSSQ